MINLAACHNKSVNGVEGIIVSIIIPAHNEEAVLSDCLDSIIKADFPKTQYEVIVVNDGSTDRTCEIANSYHAKFNNIISLSKTNGGKASAQNYGLRIAQGKYILVTDADAIVNKDWIPRMVKHLENYDIVVGAYYAKKPEKWLEKIQNAHYLIKFKYGGVRGIPPTGVNNAFKKEVVGIIGEFDENKTSTTSEFIDRGKKKGLKIQYDPDVYVYTKCTSNIQGFLRQKLRWRETGASDLKTFGYTYGLSIFLFASFLLSVYQMDVSPFTFVLIATYMLSFSIYLNPFYKMLISEKDRYFAKYFLLYELIEMGVRFLLVPYMAYRLLVPRTRPTFEAKRG